MALLALPLLIAPGAAPAQDAAAETAAPGTGADSVSSAARRPALGGVPLRGSGVPAASGLLGGGLPASGTANPPGTAPLGADGILGGAPAPAAGGEDESVSRLPRFRASPGLPGSAAKAGSPARATGLRLRAAPPRRIGSATKSVTQTRTQGMVTDLRLTPVIQNPVSGVPLPTTLPPLGLVNPAGILLGTALRRPIVTDQAYAPLGLRLGTFTVLPALTQSIGYDTNPDQTVMNRAKPSLALRTEGEVALRSDWSASEFTGEMRGSYLEFPQNEAASRPSASGVARLRIDANRDTRIDLETRFLLDSQRTGSPDLAATPTARPLFATYGATAGVTESFNRLQLTLRGSIDRQVFQDAQLSDGTVIRQSDRDANQYGVRLRAGYEISPMITPFVEALFDTRVYDTPVDQYGLRRDSDGIALTAGARVELSRALSAEISAGWQHRAYVDPTLRAIDAPLVNAALIWAVSPLTTVRFNQQTGVVETAVPNSSGVFTDATTLEVQHDLLRNLSITLGGAFLTNTYEGANIREKGYSATARLDYRFNRWLSLRGSYIYSTLTSTSAQSAYDAHTVLVGLRVNP